MIIKKLLDLLGMHSSQRYSDGSEISFINRDEYKYTRADGKYVNVYIFLTGKGKFDRILVKDSLSKWSYPDKTEEISQEEQNEILIKFAKYKRFCNKQIGLGLARDVSPVELNAYISNVQNETTNR